MQYHKGEGAAFDKVLQHGIIQTVREGNTWEISFMNSKSRKILKQVAYLQDEVTIKLYTL